jgi:hypothetical protein
LSTKPLDRETYIETVATQFDLTKKTTAAILGPLLDERDALREQLAAARANLEAAIERNEAFKVRYDGERVIEQRALEAEATAERLVGALKHCLAELPTGRPGSIFDNAHQKGRAALLAHKSGTALAEHDKALTERIAALESERDDAVFAATSGHSQACACDWCGRLKELIHPSEGGALTKEPRK